jgi:protein TonB
VQGGSRPAAAAPALVARLIEPAPALPPSAQEPAPISVAPTLAAESPTAMISPPPLTELPGAAPFQSRSTDPLPAVAKPETRPTPAEPLPLSDPTLASEASPAPLAGGESRAAGLDRGPRPLDDVEPVFPAAAGARGGTVTLRLVISDRGEVESIVVVHAVPPGLFDDAALAAFGRARFAPGLRGGIPVRSEVMYEVEFAPLGKGTESSGRTY